jgi:hypothetical protein
MYVQLIRMLFITVFKNIFRLIPQVLLVILIRVCQRDVVFLG